MAKKERTIRVFIASPGDLAVERRAFKDVLDELNTGFGDGAKVKFEPLGWEDTLASTGRRSQSVINLEVDRCDVFVLALYARWGQAAPDALPFSSYDDGSHPTVNWVLRCLSIGSVTAYNKLVKELDLLTTQTQTDERIEKVRELFLFEREFTTNRYCMFVIRIIDDRDNQLADYDLLFTAGPSYDENHLPPGFFVDRQRNQLNPGKLTYYIDDDIMSEWLGRPELEGKFGIRISARPAEGFAYYTVAEHKGTFGALKRYFEPNQTLMVEIELHRHVDQGVFQRLSENVELVFSSNQAAVA